MYVMDPSLTHEDGDKMATILKTTIGIFFFLNIDSNFTDPSSQRISLDNNYVLDIIWNIAGLVFGCIYAFLCLDKLPFTGSYYCNGAL